MTGGDRRRRTPIRGTYSQAEETAGGRTFLRNDRTEVKGQGVLVEAGKRLAGWLGPQLWIALNAVVRSCNFILLATESREQQGHGDKLVGRWGRDGRRRRHGVPGWLSG